MSTEQNVPLTNDQVVQLEEGLLDMGFRIYDAQDKEFHKKQFDFEEREESAGELGFIYHACGLEVIVWTSVNEATREAHETGTDMGWVIISENGVRKHTSTPFLRTSGFVDRILRYARIRRDQIKNRPVCPVCNHPMQIVKNEKNRRSRHLSCDHHLAPEVKAHPKHLPWDYGLPSEDIDFLNIRRKGKTRQRGSQTEKGLPTDSAQVIRNSGQKRKQPVS